MYFLPTPTDTLEQWVCEEDANQVVSDTLSLPVECDLICAANHGYEFNFAPPRTDTYRITVMLRHDPASKTLSFRPLYDTLDLRYSVAKKPIWRLGQAKCKSQKAIKQEESGRYEEAKKQGLDAPTMMDGISLDLARQSFDPASMFADQLWTTRSFATGKKCGVRSRSRPTRMRFKRRFCVGN